MNTAATRQHLVLSQRHRAASLLFQNSLNMNGSAGYCCSSLIFQGHRFGTIGSLSCAGLAGCLITRAVDLLGC